MAQLLPILPCPFCGGPASLEETTSGATVDSQAAFSVGCDADEAECMGYQSLTTFARRSDAIAAWNRRAGPPSETRAALRTAVQHIEHMAAWIGKQNASYSFESLGEDMPSIKAALAGEPTT